MRILIICHVSQSCELTYMMLISDFTNWESQDDGVIVLQAFDGFICNTTVDMF